MIVITDKDFKLKNKDAEKYAKKCWNEYDIEPSLGGFFAMKACDALSKNADVELKEKDVNYVSNDGEFMVWSATLFDGEDKVYDEVRLLISRRVVVRVEDVLMKYV